MSSGRPLRCHEEIALGIRLVIVDDEALARSGRRLTFAACEEFDTIALDPLDSLDIDATDAEALPAPATDVTPTNPGATDAGVRDGITAVDSPHLGAVHLGAALPGIPQDPHGGAAASADPLHRSGTDAVLLDIRIPGRDGYDMLREIRESVVRSVIASGLDARHRATARLLDTLTVRERQVLSLLATGVSNAEIGACLHLSLGTVKDHVSAILTKLGVSSRLQAALLVERMGRDPR